MCRKHITKYTILACQKKWKSATFNFVSYYQASDEGFESENISSRPSAVSLAPSNAPSGVPSGAYLNGSSFLEMKRNITLSVVFSYLAFV